MNDEWGKNQIDDKCSELKGLVLCGGLSQRMGFDKAKLTYGAKEQVEVCGELLEKFCSHVYLSCRTEQELTTRWTHIYDIETGGGPIVGLVQAYKELNGPLLVVAPDMPWVNELTIETLLRERQVHKDVTLYQNPEGLFEPLLAIWEVSALQSLVRALSHNRRSLQKKLQLLNLQLLVPDDHKVLQSVNTKAEFQAAQIELFSN